MFRKLPCILSKVHLRKIFSALLFVLVLLSLVSFNPRTSNADPVTDLLQKIDQLKREISENRNQQNTLANQIKYFDNQIALTELEIQVKQQEIDILSVDIGDLTVRLDRIGNFLTYQEEIFVNRARLAYASDQLSSFDVVLGAENLDDAMRRIKYLRVLEDQDVQALNEMRDTRTSFNGQKTTLENKKSDVERLKTEAEGKKLSLISYQASRKSLLEQTKNDEQVYQSLLREAQSELEAIRRAVRLRGGASPVYNQTRCDSWGCYYNQRDSKWFYTPMGYSGLATGEYGCLVTSMAMIATHYGKNINPGNISATPSAFWGTSAFLLDNIIVGGVRMTKTSKYAYPGLNRTVIDEELAAGRPVIVGVMSEGHFVVIKGKSDGQYIMNDPWYPNAYDIPLSRYYSSVSSTRVVGVY